MPPSKLMHTIMCLHSYYHAWCMYTCMYNFDFFIPVCSYIYIHPPKLEHNYQTAGMYTYIVLCSSMVHIIEWSDNPRAWPSIKQWPSFVIIAITSWYVCIAVCCVQDPSSWHDEENQPSCDGWVYTGENRAFPGEWHLPGTFLGITVI